MKTRSAAASAENKNMQQEIITIMQSMSDIQIRILHQFVTHMTDGYKKANPEGSSQHGAVIPDGTW